MFYITNELWSLINSDRMIHRWMGNCLCQSVAFFSSHLLSLPRYVQKCVRYDWGAFRWFINFWILFTQGALHKLHFNWQKLCSNSDKLPKFRYWDSSANERIFNYFIENLCEKWENCSNPLICSFSFRIYFVISCTKRYHVLCMHHTNINWNTCLFTNSSVKCNFLSADIRFVHLSCSNCLVVNENWKYRIRSNNQLYIVYHGHFKFFVFSKMISYTNRGIAFAYAWICLIIVCAVGIVHKCTKSILNASKIEFALE